MLHIVHESIAGFHPGSNTSTGMIDLSETISMKLSYSYTGGSTGGREGMLLGLLWGDRHGNATRGMLSRIALVALVRRIRCTCKAPIQCDN